jgi:teichuronic acid exporter
MFKLVLWDFFGKFANQFVGLIVSIVLARLLVPEQFGIIGIALALVGFSSIFFDFGFISAIIQKDEVTQKQLSTVFYLNLSAGIFLCLLFSLSSSAIENFYKIAGLGKVIVAVSFLFIINSLFLVPAALLSRGLQFKKLSLIYVAAALLSGFISIYFAYQGWGVWSLVLQAVINAVVVLVGTFFASRWKPDLIWDFISIKPLWKFGSRIFFISMLENIFIRIDVFMIGKIFGGTTLGYYTRAQSLDTTVRQFSSGSIVSVVLPFFSRMKNDLIQLHWYYFQSLHFVSFISIMIIGNLYLVAPELFELLFSAKWIFSGYIYQILALAGFAYPISALMVNVLWSRGNEKIFVRVEIYKKLLLLPVFCFGFLWGLKIFMYTLVVANILMIGINAWFVSKDISVSFTKQIRVIAEYLLMGTMVTVIFALIKQYYPQHLLWKIALLCISFTTVYFIINVVLKSIGSHFFLEKMKLLFNKLRPQRNSI